LLLLLVIYYYYYFTLGINDTEKFKKNAKQGSWKL